MTARGQRGLALVSVLWGIAILSLIAAAMLSASLTSAQIDRNVWNATRAGAVADAVINRAILELMDERGQPRTDGKPATVMFDGVPVRLWIQDEGGKINLNLADKSLLRNLFASAGVAQDEAGILADRIVAMRTPAGPFPFRAVDDLLAIPGITPALFRRVAPALTVYGRSGAINPAVAPREVLRALPDMTDQTIADLIKARDEPQLPATGAAGQPNSDFLVTAEVRVAGAHVVRTSVVQFTGDPGRPYLILAWR
jgi:general secretion pathway protein K